MCTSISDLAENSTGEKSSAFPCIFAETELLLYDKVPLSLMELPGSFRLIIAAKNP